MFMMDGCSKYRCKLWCKLLPLFSRICRGTWECFFNRKINQEDGGARFYWMFSNVKFQYQKFLFTQIELGEEIVPCQCRCPF